FETRYDYIWSYFEKYDGFYNAYLFNGCKQVIIMERIGDTESPIFCIDCLDGYVFHKVIIMIFLTISERKISVKFPKAPIF
ncbi:MAG TPA: hypothetical protein DDW17_07290, partial [Deltaproteobacteria bacterium]|nr:hypothetical protein [Deltaproteobacteria bacterium]